MSKPYTVAQLIADLETFPKDMRVMVRGYEGGFNDASTPGLIAVKLDQNIDTWWMGDHSQVDFDSDDFDCRAIVI